MSMTRADILHGVIVERIDNHVADPDIAQMINQLVDELYDIAEGDASNERDAD